MSLTIEDLLNSLDDPNLKPEINGTKKDIWARIGSKDDFSELGLEKSELDAFLTEWTEANPYNNI